MGILLILVITLAMVLFIAGVSQLFFSSQVYRQTARGSGGLAAEYLARSAVEEILYKLQITVNDPTRPLFKRLREALLKGEPGKAPGGLLDLSSEFDCSLLTDQLDKSTHKAFYKSFKIDGLTCLAGFDTERPEYTNLLVKLGATARLSLGGRVVSRRVEETRQMGMLLVGPKRPLDQVGFLVLGNPFLRDFTSAVDAVTRMAGLYTSIAGWLTSWKGVVEQKPYGQTLSIPTQIPSLTGSSGVRAVTVQLTGETYEFDGLWQPLNQNPNSIRLPPPSAYLVAPGSTEPVDLKSYDHESSFVTAAEPALGRIPEVVQRLDRVMETLVTSSGRPFTSSEQATWAAQIGQVGREIHDVLDTLIESLASTSTALAPHLKSLPQLDGFSLDSQGRLGPALYPMVYHISTPKQFEQLMKSHKRLNAHIAYQGTEPLRIDLLGVMGKMVISSQKAPVEVANLLANSREEDLIVLAAPDVILDGGTVDAGIIVRNRLHIKSEVSIRGNLVLENYPRRRDRRPDEDLHGHLFYNPNLYSGKLVSKTDARGVLWNHYALGFSSVPEDLEILWKE